MAQLKPSAAKGRFDASRKKLKTGETVRSNGTYSYNYFEKGVRHYVYAKTLTELREKEDKIRKDMEDGISTNAANQDLNHYYDLWCSLKRGLKDNTFQNYKYMYELFIKDDFGKNPIGLIKRSDVKKLYTILYESRGVKISTIDNIHTVLHQVFQLAVDDDIIRKNPSDNVMKELRLANNVDSAKVKVLTATQVDELLSFMKESNTYKHWYPQFAFMFWTGLRVGEVTAFRWDDIDFKHNEINIDKTLVYYQHSDGKCFFGINTTKTKNGTRTVPMLNVVKEALLEAKEYQKETGLSCNVSIDGYTNFIFVNKERNVQNQSTLNKALKRIIRDYNYKVMAEERPEDLIGDFSCHTTRKTFCTRLCEAGVNVKVIQYIMGHGDISTTMDIYTGVTKQFSNSQMATFEEVQQKMSIVQIDNDKDL